MPTTTATAESPIIYKLYGSAENRDSLVITESDLLDFLVNIVKKSPPIPDYIASRFADKDTSFLFVGFGFEQWHYRIFLHMLNAHGHKNRSLALEDQAFFEHPDQRRTAVFYQHKHYLDFRSASLDVFAQELKNNYQQQVGRPEPTNQLADDAPRAFLCYCSEDSDAVLKIQNLLHRGGIDTWRDKQNLRGGDDWDRQIEHVLQKQVDYVLVLQTPRMLARSESYYYKEINLALERQHMFARGRRFVIPCLLEGDDGLEELSQLHKEDVTSQAGINSLKESILRDWKDRSPPSAPEK